MSGDQFTSFSAAWQQVKCVGCGAEYRCTPSSDSREAAGANGALNQE